MNLKIKKFKINPKTTAIIVGIVLFALITPNFVNALSASGIAQSIFKWAASLILNFFGIFVDLAANFFESTLNLEFVRGRAISELGWGVVRDLSNMFFILFMVIIAFATILRLEKYGIKELLPKVIIIALLINFSLVICYVIIDFSDIAARYFITNARQGANGQQIPIATTLKSALNLTRVYVPVDCQTGYNEARQKCAAGDEDCLGKVEDDLVNCTTAVTRIQGTNNTTSNFLNMIVSMVFGSIILMVAAFVLFVGGIMLIIRLLFLWFLVILAPIVFVCYIMPGLRSNWQKWWHSFLNWCLFAPIYCFFLWLAIKIATEQRLRPFMNAAQDGAQNQSLGTDFFSRGDHMLGFLFIIAFLLGGLIAAKQLGIYGADTALKIGQKAYGGAKNWLKQTSTRPLRAAGTVVGAGALTVGGTLFGGKLGRRMKARATELKTTAQERPEQKRFAKLLTAMSEGDVLREMKTPGIRGFMATREAAKRGSLRDAGVKDVQIAMQKLKAFNEVEAYNKLKETRADALQDKTEQKNTIEKVTQEGNLNKIPAIALKDEKLVAAIAEFASAKQVESLRDASPQHTENLKTTLGELTTTGNATLSGMTAGDQDKIHSIYASQTGDISRMSDTQTAQWAQKAGPEGIKRLNLEVTGEARIKLIAENLPENQASNIVSKIQDGRVAKIMAERLAEVNPNLVTNDYFLKGLVRKTQAPPSNTVNLKNPPKP